MTHLSTVKGVLRELLTERRASSREAIEINLSQLAARCKVRNRHLSPKKIANILKEQGLYGRPDRKRDGWSFVVRLRDLDSSSVNFMRRNISEKAETVNFIHDSSENGRKENLEEHSPESSQKTSHDAYFCQSCGVQFRGPLDFRWHLRSKHQVNEE
jgi:hypothetical protein